VIDRSALHRTRFPVHRICRVTLVISQHSKCMRLGGGATWILNVDARRIWGASLMFRPP